MNISRLLPFLPLLLLSAGAPLIQTNTSHLNPSDLCPLVQIVEHELCVNAKNFTDLCVLLHNYNASFCSNAAEPLSNDVLSLEKEFNKEIHNLCPILNFIDEELCTSREEFQFYPKQLCPLLNITYTELCSL
jgi:hypothetical protein